MLFNPIGKAQAERLQGPFVTDEEVNAVIEFWKAQAEESDGPNRIMESINTVKIDIGDEEEEDELLNDAIELVVNAEQASASMLQRRVPHRVITVRDVWWISWNRGELSVPAKAANPAGFLFPKRNFMAHRQKGRKTAGYSLKISRFPTRSQESRRHNEDFF